MLMLLALCAACAPGAPAPDSAGVIVVFSATGGLVTRSGLYTAGPRGGAFRITASVGEVAGAAPLTVAEAPVSTAAATPVPAPRSAAAAATGAGGRGIPFGPFGGWRGANLRANTDGFTLVLGSDNPGELPGRIRAAQAGGKRLLLAMTGGGHDNYKTGGVFDVTKWQARMSEYRTARIQEAVAAGVADGTIIGNSVMDEPHNTSRENSWGPPGTMTKARVDDMCAYVKDIFPTLPVGVVHDYRVFEPERDYAVCDFVVSQYRTSKGSVTEFRDNGLAFAKRSGVAIAFSLNILDGGERMTGCPTPTTGGRGTYGGNCRMRPDQILEYATVLGPAGCAFTMWRYDEVFMADPENQRVFREIADLLARSPDRPCRRA